MAVWTPGSYLIREYERNVEAVDRQRRHARAGGREVDARTAGRSRPAARRRVTLRYKRLRPRDDGPQQLGRGRLRDAERRADVHHAGRARRASARSARRAAGGVEERRRPRSSPSAGSPNTYRAEDFDTLVDSPIIIGNPVTREFTVDGKTPLAGARRRHVAVRRRSRRRRRAEDRRRRRRT